MEITENAKKHLLSVIEDDFPHVRFALVGGGCSGFQYSFRLNTEEDIQLGDLTLGFADGHYLLVDPITLGYMEESIIEYSQDLMGARLVVNNPNVQSTCGCGESVNFG